MPESAIVIALAHQTGLRAIIDDLKARTVAEKMGLKITGTIGVLLKAEKLGLIDDAYEKTRELKERGFFVSDDLLEKLIKLSRPL